MLKNTFVTGLFLFLSTECSRTEQTHAAEFIENQSVGYAEESFLFWVLCSSIALAFLRKAGHPCRPSLLLRTINSSSLLWGVFFFFAVNTGKIINFSIPKLLCG